MSRFQLVMKNVEMFQLLHFTVIISSHISLYVSLSHWTLMLHSQSGYGCRDALTDWLMNILRVGIIRVISSSSSLHFPYTNLNISGKSSESGRTVPCMNSLTDFLINCLRYMFIDSDTVVRKFKVSLCDGIKIYEKSKWYEESSIIQWEWRDVRNNDSCRYPVLIITLLCLAEIKGFFTMPYMHW